MPDFSAFNQSGAFPASYGEFFAAHIRPEGRPWSYDGHEYLKDIVEEEAPVVDIIKGAQLGLSTVAIGRGFKDAGMGLRAAHFLPTREQMHIFVQEKVDPLINADDALARAVIEAKEDTGPAARRLRQKLGDNSRRKQFGDGALFYQGLQKQTDVKTFSYDSIVFDELDELNPELVPWLKDRLLHSSYDRRFSLSQPSVPDFGIHAAFLAGDQRYFKLKCSRCRRWCNLQDDWPDCLALKGAAFVSARTHKAQTWRENRIICKRCGASVSIREAADYAWVPKEPKHDTRSYSVSQLYGPFCTADKIAARWHAAQRSRAELASLTISIVGLSYAGDRQPVNDEVLTKASGDWQCGPPAVLDALVPAAARRSALRIAGIDPGDVIHAVAAEVLPAHVEGPLAGAALVFDVKAFDGDDPWDDLAAWLRNRGITFFVIDAAPYTHNSKALCRAEGLNGAMCRFSGTDLVVDFDEKQHPFPVRVVKCDRTDAIDEMADALVAKELLLPSARLDVMGEVKKHCKALVKDLQTTGALAGRYTYKRNVTNHYGLALTYLQLARRACELLDLMPAEPFGDPSSHLGGNVIAATNW